MEEAHKEIKDNVETIRRMNSDLDRLKCENEMLKSKTTKERIDDEKAVLKDEVQLRLRDWKMEDEVKLYQEKIVDVNQSTKESNDIIEDEVALKDILEDDVKRLEATKRTM